jgi:GNAT superfamily N-acetyltransferase
MIERRDVAGTLADVRAMQRLCERIWWTGGGWHVGDLAWGRFQHVGREPEWPTALWERDGEVLAWAWVRLPGHLDLAVDPAYPRLVGEILDWFPTVATADELTAYAMSGEAHLVDAFRAAGYAPVEDPERLIRYEHDLADLPEPVLPDGFTVRHVRGVEDLERRVEVHRSAFHPSRVTVESYANVMTAWPYRPDLDWVVEAPDGRFAASCLIWWDERNKVGELEPVGTHADFRRMGLASAACLGALRALRDLGATTGVVCSHVGPGHEAPRGLYPSLGFADHSETVRFARPRIPA